MANQISGNKILPTEITDDLIVKLGLDNHHNSSQSQGSFDLQESETQIITSSHIQNAQKTSVIKKLSNNNNRLVMSQLRRTEFEHRRRTIMTQKSFGNQVNAQTPVSQIESPKSSQHFHDALGEYCVEDSPKNQVVSKFQQT